MNTSSQSTEFSAIFDQWIANFLKFYRIVQFIITKLLVTLKQGIANSIKTAKREFTEIRSKLSLVDYLFLVANLFLITCAILITFTGFGVLGYQTILWLQDGVWKELPLLITFNFLFEGTSIQGWFNNPQSWFGLHQIMGWCLKTIPISLTLILHGMFFFFLTTSLFFISIVFRYFWIKNRTINLKRS